MARTRTKWDTRGGDLLRAWLKAEDGRTSATIATRLRVDGSTVWRWLNGHHRPAEGTQRDALRALCGIEPDAWRTSEERHAAAETIARAAS